MLLIAGVTFSPTGSTVEKSSNDADSCRVSSVEGWYEWNSVATNFNASRFPQSDSCALDNFNYPSCRFDAHRGNSLEHIDQAIIDKTPPDIKEDCLSKWSTATKQGRREDEVHSYLNILNHTQGQGTRHSGEEPVLYHSSAYAPEGEPEYNKVSQDVTSFSNHFPNVDFQVHREDGTSLCSENVRYILVLLNSY